MSTNFMNKMLKGVAFLSRITIVTLLINLLIFPVQNFRAEEGYSESSGTIVIDNTGGSAATMSARAQSLQLETGTVSVGGTWTVVTLNNTYDSPVVVCVINYNNNSIPVLARVRNAAGNSFEVKLQNPSGSAVSADTVHYLVMEEGAWQLPDGRNIEAAVVLSDGTSSKGSYDNSLMELYTYQQSYTSPVVLGQVMTENDANFSVFWSSDGTYNDPPDATICYVGKNVGEDSNETRADETLGVIVIEAGSGSIDATPYEAALGPDIVRAPDNGLPDTYTLSSFSAVPEIGIACQSAMDGADGTWALLYGASPLSATTLDLMVDEDQISDSERKHTTEQVAYIVFESSVLISAGPVNESPVANDDSYQVDQDTTLNVAAPGVLGNDTDAEIDPLTAILVTDVANGTLTLNSDGSFDYTPNAGYTGSDSFTYKANDGNSDSNDATVTITVTDVPEAPTANDDSYQVNQDTALNISAPGVLGNDTDPENDPLTAILVTDAANGTLALNSDGSFDYTPNAGYTGADSFTYKANDGGLDSNDATVTITVIPDVASGLMLESGTVSVGDTWTTVTLNNTYASPVVVCVINYNNNTTSVVPRVRNASGNSFETRLQGAPTTPVADTVHYLVVEEGTWQLPDGRDIEAAKVISDGVNYSGNFENMAVMESYSYQQSYTSPVVLGQVMTENDTRWSAFWSCNVTELDPPDATTCNIGKHIGEDPDTARADETLGVIIIEAGSGTIDGTPYETAVGAETIKGIDSVPSPPYPYTLNNFSVTPQVAIACQTAMDGGNGGWAYLYGSSPLSTTSIGLVIDEDQIADSERQHTAENVAYIVFESPVLITGTVTPEAPVANDDSYQVDEETTLNVSAPGVLGNDTDGNNDPLTSILVTDVANGTLTLNSDGSFDYTPDTGYTGIDTFTYKANDGGLDSNDATVTITVIDVPEAPTANDDSYNIDQDTTLNVGAPGVLGNDTDPENDPLTAILVTDVVNGTLSLNSDGSFSYTPDAGYTGSDSFTYKANDGGLDSNNATVTITVIDIPEAPTANDDSYNVDQDTTLNVSAPGVLGNDTDPENDPLNAILVTDVANGTLTLNSDGSFDYTPDAGYTGIDSFTYKANDGGLDSNDATVTINVTDVQYPPVANDDSYNVDQDTTLNVSAPGVLGNDTDGNNDPLTAILVTDVANGTLTLNSDGSFDYTPDAGYTGIDSFVYKANDGTDDSNDATATITVIDIPEAPTANDDSYQVNEETTLNISAPGVLGNDTDPENDPLTAILVTDVANGTLTLNSDGSFDYTPDAGYTGIDTFTYKANDGGLDSNDATVTITVIDVPEAPTSVDDSYNVDQDTTLNVSAPGVLGNDTDPENDPLTAEFLTNVQNGSLNLNSDGSFEYTPNAGFTGTDFFAYRAYDGGLYSYAAVVTITVIDVPEAPTANDDSYSVDQDTTLNVSAPGVLGNDTDPENDPLTAILVSDVANGTLTLNSDGSFDYTPDAGYTGADTFTYKANDGGLDSNDATVTITVNSISSTIRMETGTTTIDGNWTTVSLANTYASPVVVCALTYNNNSVPMVSRVRNASGNSFEVRIQNPSDGAVVSETMYYIVLEEGTWQLPDGRNIEASKIVSDSVNEDDNWSLSLLESYTYQHSYTAPVVLGQVMTENDPDWSIFWSCGLNNQVAPDATTCYVGRHVGEDPDITRSSETLGIIVIESGSGTINGVAYETAVGPQTVMSLENPSDSPPYKYTLNNFSVTPQIGIACHNWTSLNGTVCYLYGANPLSSTAIDLLIDEDQVGDTERRHGAVSLSYIVFETSIAIGGVINPVAPSANDDSYQVDQDSTLNVPAPGVLNNDSDLNNDPLTAILVTNVNNGTLTLNTDGSFSYTPTPGFIGTDSFTYKANDGTFDSNDATVSILVLSTTGPSLVGQWDFDDPTDLEKATIGPDLILEGGDEPATGYASGDGASLIKRGGNYSCYHGLPANGGGTMVNEYTLVFDVFNLLKYQKMDKSFYQTGQANGNDGELFVYETRKIGLGDLGGTSTEKLAMDTWYRVVISVDNGTDRSVYINGVRWLNGNEGVLDDRHALNEKVRFFADNDGEDNPIIVSKVILYDGAMTSTEVAALGGPPIQQMPPVAVVDEYAFDEDVTLNIAAPGVLENDLDINNDSLSAILVTDVNNGTLTLNSDGSLTYTSDPGFTGTDSFTYKVNDGSADGNTETVTIIVRSITPDPSFNTYYGDIHNHSELSDGTGTADNAYRYARDTVGYDFFSLADHANGLNKDPDNWPTLKAAAEAYNDDGNFVTFWGFEWTREEYGHCAVLNTENFIWDKHYNFDEFMELYFWLEPQTDAVAYFNHPGYVNDIREFLQFAWIPLANFVGIELWNSGSSLSTYYYNDGFHDNDGGMNHFEEAMARGWRIGASGAYDVHSGSYGWGPNRQAVLASAKTRASILSAMKARRMFSTQDSNLVMSFKMKGKQMGSEISAGTYDCEITVNDGSENITEIILFKDGAAFMTWNPNTSNPSITQQVTTTSGEFYYIKVKESDGNEAISSAIFIEN